MADREPPPFFDDSEKEDDSHDDLFVSAIQSQDVTKTNSIDSMRPVNSDDMFSGESEEIKLDDDDAADDDQLFKSTFVSAQEDRWKHPPSALSLDPSTVAAPAATTNVTTSQTVASAAASAPRNKIKSPEMMEDESGDQFIEISVTEPQKIGEGMGAYMAYKVSTKTNFTFFKNKQFAVMRRFSDFLGLHDKLCEKHTHLGRVVPPAPEKSVVGMTKIKMSKESDASASNDFVEKRRHSLERFMNRAGAHPVLRTDPDFREFLEMEGELPKATSTSALSSAGVLRLFNRMGDTVSKITFKMDETDPWFEEKQQQIENLDQQLRKLHASVEALVTFRKELALSTSVFAKSAAMLGNCEEHTALSRALSQLAEVEDRADLIHQDQANNDFYILAELLKDYISLIGAVKDVFHQRVKVYQTWQHAQQTLTKKREQKAKLELMGKTDKVPQAREEVVEWESKVERGQEEFENISKMIRKEMERFEYNRVCDFKSTIIKYMESLMNTQQQLIKCWESFLPEAKAIA